MCPAEILYSSAGRRSAGRNDAGEVQTLARTADALQTGPEWKHGAVHSRSMAKMARGTLLS